MNVPKPAWRRVWTSGAAHWPASPREARAWSGILTGGEGSAPAGAKRVLCACSGSPAAPPRWLAPAEEGGVRIPSAQRAGGPRGWEEGRGLGRQKGQRGSGAATEREKQKTSTHSPGPAEMTSSLLAPRSPSDRCTRSEWGGGHSLRRGPKAGSAVGVSPAPGFLLAQEGSRIFRSGAGEGGRVGAPRRSPQALGRRSDRGHWWETWSHRQEEKGRTRVERERCWGLDRSAG